METMFPDHTGYEGMFVIGFRKLPGTTTTQRVGTVVLKRTYDVNSATGSIAPSEDTLPVFTEDQPHDGSTDILRYEHDLVPFKPLVDVVVLGFAGVIGVNSLRVQGVTWLSRTVTALDTAPDLFGWEERSSTHRQDGSDGNPLAYSSDGDDYPPEWPPSSPQRDPLPANFTNTLFNGYPRAAASIGPLEDISAVAPIQVVRPGPSNDYFLTLRGDVTHATLHVYGGSGTDNERHWERQAITMRADTLVIEPDSDRCSLVWRGLWDADTFAEEDLRRLVVTASA